MWSVEYRANEALCKNKEHKDYQPQYDNMRQSGATIFPVKNDSEIITLKYC